MKDTVVKTLPKSSKTKAKPKSQILLQNFTLKKKKKSSQKQLQKNSSRYKKRVMLFTRLIVKFLYCSKARIEKCKSNSGSHLFVRAEQVNLKQGIVNRKI